MVVDEVAFPLPYLYFIEALENTINSPSLALSKHLANSHISDFESS